MSGPLPLCGRAWAPPPAAAAAATTTTALAATGRPRERRSPGRTTPTDGVAGSVAGPFWPNLSTGSRGRVRPRLRRVTAAPLRAVTSMAASTPKSGGGGSFLDKSGGGGSFLEHRESERLLFSKYQGLGNDFIMVDNRDSSVLKVTPEKAAELCDRKLGIGADGVIFVLLGVSGTDYTMRIFNSDGSEPEMCGNGVRCFARFIAEIENLPGTNSFTIHTGAGKIITETQSDGQVKVDMGEPILSGPDIPTKLLATKNKTVVQAELLVGNITWHVTCVSMGNPHCVTFGAKELKALQVDDLKLSEIGPKFEHHEMFPARTNTEFVQVMSRSHLKMRVWERGAGATLACGTGACAAVVAAVLERRAERKCVVDLPGGPLEIEWREDDNHVYMTGPAKFVFDGSIVL